MKTKEKLGNFFRDKIMNSTKGGLIFAFSLLAIFIGLAVLVGEPAEIRDSFEFESLKVRDCSVVGINIHGTIVTYIPEHAEGDYTFNYDVTASENIIWSIQQANKDDKIKVIVVEIDSAGGYPVAGEEIGNIIKNSEKPVIGLIREIGASGAYWAISGADKIFASKNSSVGGIGVTMSYLTNLKKNTKDGYEYQQLSAGKFKDAGSADKPLTKEERDLFMRDTNIIYENFMQAVSENRKIPLEQVKAFSDGSMVLGEKAKELGMIDEIGGIKEVEDHLEKILGEKSEICWE